VIGAGAGIYKLVTKVTELGGIFKLQGFGFDNELQLRQQMYGQNLVQ
jgi:hypothetical protein